MSFYGSIENIYIIDISSKVTICNTKCTSIQNKSVNVAGQRKNSLVLTLFQ